MPETLVDTSESESSQTLWAERINVTADGKRFQCWFATPGVVDYSDVPDGGRELIRKKALDQSVQTLVGAPLTIGHVDCKTTDLSDVENGKVTKVYWDGDEGWYCAEGTVDTPQARKCIQEGYGVSAGTKVRERDFGPGGTFLHVPYDKEIKRLKFHHLALIEPGRTPRYEDAAIRLNSTNRTRNMNWIRKILGQGEAQPKEETTALAPETKIDLGEGKAATLNELVEHYRNNAVHAIGADDVIEHDGCHYHCGTLIKHFKEKTGVRPNAEGGPKPGDNMQDTAAASVTKTEGAIGQRPNAEGGPKPGDNEQDTKAAEAVARENAVKEREDSVKTEEKRLKDEAERLNALERDNGARSFAILANAPVKPAPMDVPAPTTRASRRARGKELFGSN